MKTKFLTILFICASSSWSFAQNSFKVVALNGKITNAKNLAIKIGENLSPNDQLVVNAGGYVGLSYSKGGTVQINKAGSYKASELENNLVKSKQSATQKYASLVIGEVVKNTDADMHKNPYKYQKVTGSVERIVSLNGDVASTISSVKFKNKYEIAFDKNDIGEGYVTKIKIMDKEGKSTELTPIESKEELLVLDFEDKKFKDKVSSITVNIEQKEGKFKRAVRFSSPKIGEVEKITAEFENFKKQQKNTELSPAEIKMQEGAFWETKKCQFEAMEAYQEAMKIDQENEVFGVAYDSFLVRNHFKN